MDIYLFLISHVDIAVSLAQPLEVISFNILLGCNKFQIAGKAAL